MLKMTTIEGAPLYIDPMAIQGVAPAYAPPPPDMSPANQRLMVPKQIGCQLFLHGFNVAVRGNLDEIALQIRAAKAGAPSPSALLPN